MYLSKRTYIGAQYKHNGVKGDISLTRDNDNKPIKVNLNKLEYIIESAGYWRKANQIHKWFVDNVQDGVDDCKEYYVPEEKLKELLDICIQIRDKCPLIGGKVVNGQHYEKDGWIDIIEEGKVMTNPEIAEELLPTESGFFFGGVDYDQYYYQDILDTIDILEECLKEEDAEFYYQSSW